jgi:hypothetical protein
MFFQGAIMTSTTFQIRYDRPSRFVMTALGAGPKASLVNVSPSMVDVRMGWAFHATIPRESIASARSLNRGLDELNGPLRLGVLRGVNYWRGTSLVNGAGSGLVDITLNQRRWGRLGPFPAPMRRIVVSAEDESGLLAALNSAESASPGPGDPGVQ